MATVDPNYISSLSARFNQVFSAVEKQRSVTIPTSVRTFLEALVIESVTLRSDEWLSLQSIDCNDPTEILRTEAIASDVLRSILDKVTADQIGAVQYMTLVEVVRQVHTRWCGIFPFCRK